MQLYDFLSCFKAPDRISEAVATGNASADDIFPPGKVFQVKYAAMALHSKLRMQLNKVRISSIVVLDVWLTNRNRALSTKPS